MIKTGAGLAEYVSSKLGTAYVYGAKMEILTKDRYDSLKKAYGPNMVWESDAGKIGKMCCDCSGLISAYTGRYRSSAEYRNTAREIFPINTVTNAPMGALVWLPGHIGVYVGMEKGVPYYIAADGSAYGCRKRPLPANFTHWFPCPDVQYAGETAASGAVGDIAVGGAVGDIAAAGAVGDKAVGGAVGKITTAGAVGDIAAAGGAAGDITVGGAVTIKAGAVYGGLSAARGKAVPPSVVGRRLTVGKIQTNKGAREALLTEIFSWVELQWLAAAR
ncbi:MAG: hypothetical protein FWC55_00505 [Firmicutes bacterium]|nr:hypothetical protein [Bacillota bacterium]